MSKREFSLFAMSFLLQIMLVLWIGSVFVTVKAVVRVSFWVRSKSVLQFRVRGPSIELGYVSGRQKQVICPGHMSTTGSSYCRGLGSVGSSHVVFIFVNITNTSYYLLLFSLRYFTINNHNFYKSHVLNVCEYSYLLFSTCCTEKC